MNSQSKLVALLKTAKDHPLNEKELHRLALPAYRDLVGDTQPWSGLDCSVCKTGTYMIGGDIARIDWVWLKLAKLLTSGSISVFDVSPSQFAAKAVFDKEKTFFESLGVACRYVSTEQKHPGHMSAGYVIDYGTAFVASMHELVHTNMASMLGRSTLPRYHVCVRVLDALFDDGHASVSLPPPAAAKSKWTNTLIGFIQSVVDPAWATLEHEGLIDVASPQAQGRQLSPTLCTWLDEKWNTLPDEQAETFKKERGRFLSLSSAYIYAKAHLQLGEHYAVKDGVIKLIYGHGKAMQDAEGLDDEVYAVLAARHGLRPRAESVVDTLHPVTWCAEQCSIVSGVASQRLEKALRRDFGKKCHTIKPNKGGLCATFCSGRAIQSMKISEALPETDRPVIIVINDSSLRTAFAGLPPHVEILTHVELLTSLPYFASPPLLIEIEPSPQRWCELFLSSVTEQLVQVWSDEDGRFEEGDALVWRHVITNAIVADRKSPRVHKFLSSYRDRMLDRGVSLYERGRLEGVLRARMRAQVSALMHAQQDVIPAPLVTALKLSENAVNKIMSSRASHPDILQHLWLTHWVGLIGGEKAESVFDRLGTVLSQDLWDPERAKLLRLRGVWEVLNEESA